MKPCVNVTSVDPETLVTLVNGLIVASIIVVVALVGSEVLRLTRLILYRRFLLQLVQSNNVAAQLEILLNIIRELKSVAAEPVVVGQERPRIMTGGEKITGIVLVALVFALILVWFLVSSLLP